VADEIDRTQEIMLFQQSLIEGRRFELEPGEPGDCELCGEWSSRLIAGACAPGRDRYRLP